MAIATPVPIVPERRRVGAESCSVGGVFDESCALIPFHHIRSSMTVPHGRANAAQKGATARCRRSSVERPELVIYSNPI